MMNMMKMMTSMNLTKKEDQIKKIDIAKSAISFLKRKICLTSMPKNNMDKTF